MTDAVVAFAADWLLTYALHSSLLLEGVWLVQRAGVLFVDTHREFAWKLVLPGAVLSATLQLAVVGEPIGGTWDRNSAGAWSTLQQAAKVTQPTPFTAVGNQPTGQHQESREAARKVVKSLLQAVGEGSGGTQ